MEKKFVLVKLSRCVPEVEQFILLHNTTLEMVSEYLQTRIIDNNSYWDGENDWARHMFEVIEVDEGNANYLEDVFGLVYGNGPIEEMFENFINGSWLH